MHEVGAVVAMVALAMGQGGQLAVLKPCSKTPLPASQLWEVLPGPRVGLKNGGGCLTRTHNSPTDRSLSPPLITVSACDSGNSDQHFQYTAHAEWNLVHVPSGLCVTAKDGYTDTQLDLWQCLKP